ncbi:MAG: PAS domain-containing protein [Cyanobacteria bacterium P01_D01_bin.1]
MVSIANAPSTANKGDIAAMQQMPSGLCRQVIDSSPDWIFVKDRSCRYVLVNQSYAAALGKEADSVIGCNDAEAGIEKSLVFGESGEGTDGFSEDDITALGGETVCARHQVITTVDGTTRSFEIQRIPLRDEQGKVFACLGIVRRQKTGELEKA